jgi:23S rRNA (cytosine1962-C5)-methyltransferase
VQKLIYKPISTSGWSDYELLDTGNKRKLERFGTLILDRFEPDANWTPSLDAEVWQSAHSKYYPDRTQNAGHWQAKLNKQEEWEINLDSLRVALNLSRSRHIGIFPEQLENWRWLQTKMSNFNKPPRILNLFAYTGISSLYCAHAGAEVTHVDASRSAIEIAKKSQTSSDLGSKTIRWIVDDAIKFTEREIRRGNYYDGVILDPPLFGRGPKGEIWKFEDDIERILALLKNLLANESNLFLLTTYNINMEQREIAEIAAKILPDDGVAVEYGPLIQIEKSAGRKLKQASYVRWSSERGKIED